MKTLMQGSLLGAALAFSGVALADCPLSMPEDVLVECLTIEGSGEIYQDYQQKFAEEMADIAEQSAQQGDDNYRRDTQEVASVDGQ